MIVDIEKLKAAAEKVTSGEWYEPGDLRFEDRKTGDLHGLHHDDEYYIAAANPAVVLELIADNESTNSRLHEVAVACATAARERDQLRAEIAGLKTGYEAYEQVVQGLKAEVEVLRREREGKVLCDLELFETLRDAANTEADEHRQCMATYRPLRQEHLDAVVKECDDLIAAVAKEAANG